MTTTTEDQRVRDMAMLLGKAAYTLKRTAPGRPLAIEVARKLTDYLRRHGLEGTPLRADDGGPVLVTPNALVTGARAGANEA